MTGDDRIPERLAYPFEEAGRLLGVSESTIRRLVEQGTLKAIRVGSQPRVPRTELYRLLEMDTSNLEVAL